MKLNNSTELLGYPIFKIYGKNGPAESIRPQIGPFPIASIEALLFKGLVGGTHLQILGRTFANQSGIPCMGG